ncbi:cytochrome ubiquinol oxidase subunit I [Consotaella salsifontis]|uniref:Cytochrome bd-I ubiquinol oxidase subunit 1 apoprotein n=1 Tax=Consotaella salsifontis TaxID=1365950 RepID=A0A1T4PWZ0_9HYPH|nr:cytochrome ubiquinol oxidase subunit I [Consotaella salsifontis]SJZ96084.1 cytochrome bd-I ubiquinol oxidase subunit 1 apoprotein [Consotaella salsifontis]
MFDAFDPVLLARVQFGFTIAFHIIFPAFTIGLASYLAVLEGLWLATGRDVYMATFRYWVAVFAIVFGMGVVSGVVMSYQFGTNWSVFSDKAGPIVGPLMGYEVLTAFFLEAGFLGVMLFGLGRVGKRLHFFATVMVAIGTLISAFWILSVNSWMQTPAGYAINEAGQFVPADWFAAIFNPSFPYRLVHMVLAAYLTTSFVVGAVGALHLLRDRANPMARLMFSMALWMATIVAPLQLLAGDQHGLNTLEYQPAKVAAIEGHFEDEEPGGGMPLTLFGIPDMEAETTHYAIDVPRLGSLILTHSWDGTIPSLKSFPPEDRPNSLVVFWSFRIMVGLGLLMIAIGLWSLWRRFFGSIYESHWLQRAMLAMGPAGFIAVIAGWITTEVGRQPYTIYGLLRTSDSVSPVAIEAVGTSLTAFIIVYFLLFGAGTFYILRLMNRTPTGLEGPERGKPTRSAGTTPAPSVDDDTVATEH